MTRIGGTCLCVVIALASTSAFSADTALTVVRDVGGVSALPYYEGLHLRAQDDSRKPPPLRGGSPALAEPQRGFTESALLPVVSHRLSPGHVIARHLHAPGLTPMFLVGDDAPSRAWLRTHAEKLRALHAVGLVVNVASTDALASLRALVPGLTVAPASGDDLAQRLRLEHYPVLITATGIEQ